MNSNLIFGAFLNYVFNEWISHIPIHLLRLSFLRLFNKKIDPSSKILMHARILNFWKVEIGARTVINQWTLLDCRKHTVRIEHDVDIGPYTKIWTLGHDPDNEDHDIKGGDVIIRHHVWIASGVTILPNLTIEAGAVIASSSVLHKSVSSLDIVAGNPAKFIRKRNNALEYKLNYRPLMD